MSTAAQRKSVVTEIAEVPVTGERKLADVHGKIVRPELSRANAAVDAEHPEGMPKARASRTVLQQHVDFFDRDKDGIITPWDTYVGFRAVGFNPVFSFMAIFVIHPPFSFATYDGVWPIDPLLRIYTQNIHRSKHGSDSGVFDHEGRFNPQKFEEIFSKFDVDGKGGLTLGEVLEFSGAQWDLFDFFGWFAAKFEWLTTYMLAADDNGLLPKEAVRGIYDGSFFYYMAKRNGYQLSERDDAIADAEQELFEGPVAARGQPPRVKANGGGGAAMLEKEE